MSETLIVLYSDGKGRQHWCAYSGGAPEADSERKLMEKDGFQERGRFWAKEETRYVVAYDA